MKVEHIQTIQTMHWVAHENSLNTLLVENNESIQASKNTQHIIHYA
mgnify:CR=1 FL=1